MKIEKSNINKIDQSYLYLLLRKYPYLSSGRKNYKKQYSRVLKNILLAKTYSSLSNKNGDFICNNYIFKEKKRSVSIYLKNKKN